jgi:hypothetical protein
MGRVDFVLSIERFSNAFFGVNNDRVDELLVGASQSSDGSGPRSYTQLSTGGGTDPVRRLGSVLAPPPSAPTSIPRAVIALSASAPAGEPTPPTDLVLIRQNDVWLMRGSGGAEFAHADMTLLDLSALCGTEPINPSFLVARAVRLAGQARDSANFYDISDKPRLPDGAMNGRIMLLTEFDGGYICQTTVANVIGVRLSVTDLNRNELPDSLLVSKPGSNGPQGIAWDIPPFDPTGGLLGSDGFSALTLDGGLAITELVGIDVDADRDLELMVLTSQDLRLGDISRDGGFQQRRDADNEPETVLKRAFSQSARLVVGDVNGDGLQDVIISDGAQLTTLLGTAGKTD